MRLHQNIAASVCIPVVKNKLASAHLDENIELLQHGQHECHAETTLQTSEASHLFNALCIKVLPLLLHSMRYQRHRLLKKIGNARELCIVRSTLLVMGGQSGAQSLSLFSGLLSESLDESRAVAVEPEHAI